ncbi:LysR family transcriptional regulator [Litorilituus sediminis]|nr:LysR family transcriptional regulator [Litorilituus sediminis]
MFIKNKQKGLAYQMLVFDEVLKQGSFTAAAESLGHTKSSVSQYINQLESGLGVKLLNRSTRQLNLTAAGQQFAKRSQQLTELLTLSMEELSDFESSPSGRLAITAPHGFDAPLVTPIMAQLCQQYPKLLPELSYTDVRLDLLQHKLDMAISVGEQQDSAYHAILIGTLDSVLVASPKYIATVDSINEDNFAKQSLIILPWQNKKQLTNGQGKQLNFQSNRQLKMNTSTSAINSVKCGMGIALVPTIFVQDELNKGILLPVLESFTGEKRDVYALHSYQQQLPLVLRLFVNKLKDAFAQLARC